MTRLSKIVMLGALGAAGSVCAPAGDGTCGGRRVAPGRKPTLTTRRQQHPFNPIRCHGHARPSHAARHPPRRTTSRRHEK